MPSIESYGRTVFPGGTRVTSADQDGDRAEKGKMKSTAGERHRAQHIRATLLAGAALTAASAGCGPALPRPPRAPAVAEDYVAVPFAPRVPPVEFIPPEPVKGALWIDGGWEWTGSRYVWSFGSWVLPPAGARRARWVVVRRAADGQLFFAPSRWRDPDGKLIDDRAWATLLGPAARASSRPLADGPDGGRGRRPRQNEERERERIVTPPPSEDEDEE